jgi:hypothetical protein
MRPRAHREKADCRGCARKRQDPPSRAGPRFRSWRRPTLPWRLPQYHRRDRLNGRVRNGNGCFPAAMATRNVVFRGTETRAATRERTPLHNASAPQEAGRGGGGQADRLVSTGWLSASRRLHLRPIDVVVFDVPQGSFCFGTGFALRCFQRLSEPVVATRPCPWRDNRNTSGPSPKILSY